MGLLRKMTAYLFFLLITSANGGHPLPAFLHLIPVAHNFLELSSGTFVQSVHNLRGNDGFIKFRFLIHYPGN